jgi:hypothetical protein
MPLPWPTFTTWTRIREEDRAALSDVLAELLAHGALIGDAGRDRELYLLAREMEESIKTLREAQKSARQRLDERH